LVPFLSPSLILTLAQPYLAQLQQLYFEAQVEAMAPIRLVVEGSKFRDQHGREVTLRGINCAGDAKYPKAPDVPSHVVDKFFEGDDVSFIGRPFAVDDAHTHFSRLRRYGYNAMRYVFTWEAIEHSGPEKYDEEWIQHTISILRLAKSYGFHIWMDPHQDVWSRFSGGSGAPLWTLYAMGLDPKNFAVTEAALVHNVQPDPSKYPKMIWSTNYTRLANQTAWTMFFGGKTWAPKAIIDGVNIQDYLQDHFIAAYSHLAQRIHEAGDLEHDVVIGWESVNEPNRGLISIQDISVIPPEQKLQKGTSPTGWQAILTGSGRACEIDTWDFGGMGPYKTGSQLVDPKGAKIWLGTDEFDKRYGFKRDPSWKLGECIWAQHGVWDPRNDVLLKKDYFGKLPKSGQKIDYEYFTNHFFMDYYRKHAKSIKKIWPESIMLCQPPVLEIPPSIKDTKDDDPNMVYSPHYYDGVTLMTKKWNRLWNVDVFGILRGKYWSPAFAVKIGETAIRNCLRDQLKAIRKEGVDYMGRHPCVFTEIGIPYDMDDKAAYKNGDYTSQALAMDANHFALEGAGVEGYGLWVYTTENCHKWGDMWNGEDLSIYSRDDLPLPNQISLTGKASKDLKSHANKKITSTPSMTSTGDDKDPDLGAAGLRAAEAYVRPAPVNTSGEVQSYGFDLQNGKFELVVSAKTKAASEAPTEIFLPEFHFPKDATEISVTAGRFEIFDEQDDQDKGVVQRLRWWNAAGEQKISVQGIKHKIGAKLDEGYIEQCQQQKCQLM